MNKKILTPLFVAASFLLIGCSTDEIVGRPSWIDDDIIDVGGLKDNKMKEIYDAIKELGDTNSSVLNKVMYDIAKGQLGTFEELKKFKDQDFTADLTDFKAFVEAHKMYQPDAESAVIENNEVVVKELKDLTEEQKNTISREKIKQQHDAIVERVCELMYNEVKDGSYYTDGVRKLFDEEEYVNHLTKELYWPDATGFTLHKNKVFVPKQIDNTDDDTWEKHANRYLCLTDTNGNFTKVYYPTDSDVDPHHDGGYIGRKILPDVYRELLIENYVREQRYTNLGRAYARKVKMIKIEGGKYVGKVGTMLRNYARDHIVGDDGVTFTPATPGSFDDLNEAMIGVVGTTDSIDSHKYLSNAGFTPIKLGSDNLIWQSHFNISGQPATSGVFETNVYYGTKLGDIVEKFTKAYDFIPASGGRYNGYQLKSPITEEVKTAYNDLTNNGTYPIDVALELKEKEIFSTDLTQDGWFLKNGGLTELNDDFRNNLFNISTSNIVDNDEKIPGAEEWWGDYETGDTARYFKLYDSSIKQTNHAYLLGKGTDPIESVVLQDGSNNFYIVEIEEAASLAKLSIEDKRAYIKLKATTTLTDSNKAMNEIVRNVTKQVASGDTYKKNAEQYYLMISNILFYDQSVYDYFKSQFPDLFK